MLRACRQFSTAPALRSRIGSAPILMPEGVSITVVPKTFDPVAQLRMSVDKHRNGKPKVYLTKTALIEGPRGRLQLDLADFVHVRNDSGVASVRVDAPTRKHQRAMWGTSRGLLSNAVTGVTEGHLCILKLVGTGFRAAVDGNRLVLRVGFSIPRVAEIPEGITVKVPVPHRVLIEGADKQQVKLLAARVRAFRKPEPYKGKGIFVDDETIKLKQKKIK